MNSKHEKWWDSEIKEAIKDRRTKYVVGWKLVEW